MKLSQKSRSSSKNTFFLVLLLLMIFSAGRIATLAFDDDTEPVTITSISVSPDRFVCAMSLDNPNSEFTITVEAQDNVGVTLIQADLSGLDMGIQDLIYNIEAAVWEGTFSVFDTSAFDFTPVEIPILADDEMGNGFQPAEGVNPAAEVVLYAMTAPPTLSECQQPGSDTTNFCDQQDFTNINFIYEVEQYGSAQCNNGVEMPWGSQYEKIIRWEFHSVNFDDSAIAEKLRAVADALQVFITRPGEFGDSYIKVNTPAFEALDTATTITVYGLPFAAEPTIVEPEGREDTITDNEFWLDNPYEIEIYDEETGEYLFTQYVPYGTLTFTVEGFSQYDMTDDDAPLVEITSPSDSAYIDSSPVEGEVYVDGTGSQIHRMEILLDEEAVISYNYWEILESCSADDDSFTQVYCNFQLENVAEGEHVLKVIATDLGGEAGNSASQEIRFFLDSTAPEIKYFLITPEEASAEETITILVKAVDAGSGLQALTLILQETETGYEPDSTSEGIYSFSIPLLDFSVGAYTLVATATDNFWYSSTETKTFEVTENATDRFAYLDSRAVFDTETEEIISVPELNIHLRITVLENSTTSVLLKEPAVVLEADEAGLHLDNFVEIVAPDLEKNLNSTRITFNYTDTEVAAKGIDESTLRLYFYNETNGSWVKYDGNDGEAPDGGVDTEANEVWAVTNHFSIWGTFGSAPAASPSAPSTSQSGGGGSGGFRRLEPSPATATIPAKNPLETAASLVPATPGDQPAVNDEGSAEAVSTEEVLDGESTATLPPADNGGGNFITGQAVSNSSGQGMFGRFTAPSWGVAIAAVGVLVLVGGLGLRKALNSKKNNKK